MNYINYTLYPEDSKEFPWDENDLKNFKKLISEKGIKCQMNDIFLLGFLRAREFDTEKSLQLLRDYYAIRGNNPYFFKDLLPSKLGLILSMNIFQVLPTPDQHIILIRLGNWNASVADFTEFCRALILFMDFLLNYHRNQKNKIIMVSDAEGISKSHFLQFHPKVVFSLVSVVFKHSYQLQYAGMHFVNLNRIMKAMLSIVLPLFPNQLKKNTYLHTKLSSLHQFVHPQYLPKEYGGELDTFDPTEFNKMILANEEFFKKNEEYLNSYEDGKCNKLSEVENNCSNEDKFSECMKEGEEKFNRIVNDPEHYFTSVADDYISDVTYL